MTDTPTLRPLQRAFLALEEAREKIAALEGAAREPIAIVGMGCRVPGAANPDEFWTLVRDGVDAVGPIPPGRFDLDAIYANEAESSGRSVTREAGFLPHVDRFDPVFFGIAPREAHGMDPQQRLLLEVAWEALENAGQAPDRLERSATGVYVGVASTDYANMIASASDPALFDSHYTSGVAHSVVSGRVSYLLGLQGPSITIDTACSSSLVAVHLACQALRARECRVALAGGVNLMLSPDLFVAFSHSRMLAPDGRCKPFDAAANGFGRGEGCGVVVLKRLSDAKADGDRILAVIRGSAVNQDGPSSGLTAPNGPQQEAVIREALDRAGVTPADVGYVEAHGTGTELGDPLEVQALGAVFAERPEADPLTIGSAKSNIGHLEAAAGVVGLIRAVLALRHKAIPPHLHFRTPSPHIPWADLRVRVATALTEWTPANARRIAGVSSFGFSGTNAHVVVEEAPAPETPSTRLPAAALAPCVLAISAHDDEALAELAARYAEAVAAFGDDDLADICHTANAGRAHFAARAIVVCRTAAELREGLRALARGEEHVRVRRAVVPRGDPPRIAFLYTGQGSQYAGMARRLYDTAPVFRAALDDCATHLDPLLQRPLIELLFADGDETALDETANTQPALFAVEYALTRLLDSWGVAPVAVMGHSVGEYVAACVAGVMTLHDALTLIAARGRLMQSLPPGGGMTAIFAPESRVAVEVAKYRDRLSIAAVNTAGQTVISGALDAVEAVMAKFTTARVRCKRLHVSHAFHSPLLDSMLGEFERIASGVTFAPPQIRLISNLTGKSVSAADVGTAAYWRRHAREAVRFADGVRTMAALGLDAWIEVGPHPTLLSFAVNELGDASTLLVPTLKRDRDDREQVAELLSALYLRGVAVDWRGVNAGTGRRIVDLPTYPFRRERYWFSTQSTRAARPRGRDTGNPLLGTRLRLAGTAAVFETPISADSPAFIGEHRVQGRVIAPATAMLEALAAAAADVTKDGNVAVTDVTIEQALVLDDEGAPGTMQVVCTPSADGAWSAVVHSLGDDSGGDDSWTTHATATLRRAPVQNDDGDLAAARARCGDVASVDDFYKAFARRGLDFGPTLHSIRALQTGENEAVGDVALDETVSAEAAGYRMHPVLLDGCLQVLAGALPVADDVLYLPIGVGAYQLTGAPGVSCTAHARVIAVDGDTCRATITMFDGNGARIASLSDVQLKRVTRDALERLDERWLDDAMYAVRWVRSELPASSAGEVLAIADLAAKAHAERASLRDASRLDEYDRMMERLESACADYIVHTLDRLGWRPAAGERVETTALAARLGIAPHHGALFGRLLAILAEEGLLEARGSEWFVRRAFAPSDPAPHLAELARAFPPAAAEIEMTARTSAAMAEALRGEREPMQLLFPNGSIENAERMYRDSPTGRYFNGLVNAVMSAEAARARPDRPLRILEIGAGTGGTTSHVVPKLAGANVEYTFTDVGPLFVARAQDKFGAYGFMRYQTFDLEGDPAEQGLAAGAFDVIIASNVIHATRDLGATLRKVRSLLAPDGLFAMLEVTVPRRWFDMTVGLTSGWWAFTDKALRPSYPTVDGATWIRLLGDTGFVGATAIPGDGNTGTEGAQSLFIARAPSLAQHREWLVFADDTGTGDALVRRLRADGASCTVVRRGSDFAHRAGEYVVDVASAGDYRTLLSMLRESGIVPSGVVHLWSLDAPRWEDTSAATLAELEGAGPVSALLVAQTMADTNVHARLWLVTRGARQADERDDPLSPAQSPVWGFGLSAALEHPELECTMVDLDPRSAVDDVDALAAELRASADEPQVALRATNRLAARLGRITRVRTHADHPLVWRVVPATAGSLDELRLDPTVRRAPRAGEVEIAVEATGLNFKDVLNVLGMYPGDPGPLGGECAGTVVAVGPGVTHVAVGDAVLAAAGGSFASHVVARAEFVQKRPAGMTAEEGAAFPIAFLTADFCLNHLAKLRAGERVLIHAAAGGVGMAAVRLAQRAGADVFATAGAEWKRELLRSIGVEHVFDSRTTDFAAHVDRATNGRGVDVVLNSLSGDIIDASFGVLARGGRFIEIGKRGIKTRAEVDALGRGHVYEIVDWGETGEQDPALIGRMLGGLMDALRAGAIASLPRHTFALSDVARAFRFMAQARHAGKIVVRHTSASGDLIRGDGTYIVTGGLSGLGPVVARWLANRGAGRLVLLGRRGVTADAAPVIEEIRNAGVDVVAESLDITDANALRALLATLRTNGPPIRGVFHSAGVLDEAALRLQTAESFARVMAPKVRGAYLLDTVTRSDPIDAFVLFSSAASVLGSPGQANHSAANAFLDVLAALRRGRGVPGTSINWGAWSEVGAAADRGAIERLEAQGMAAVSPRQGIQAMERVLRGTAAQVALLPVNWRRYLERSGAALHERLLADVVAPAARTASSTSAAAPRADIRAEITAAPAARRPAMVSAFVREKALRALGLDVSRSVDPRTPLGDLGLDSLLAVELRNVLGKAVGRTLPATLLFDYPTIETLTTYFLTDVFEVTRADGDGASSTSGPAPAPPRGVVEAIEELSDEEVDRQLAARAARNAR